jgi:transposase
MNSDGPWVGIDISKKSLDIYIRPSGEHLCFGSTEQDISRLVEHLASLHPALVVMEATGGLETLLAVTLTQTGCRVAIVNPRQVRDFAKATGRLAKTDRLDAEVIAHYAEAIRPQVRSSPDETTRHLGELVTRRHQVVEMITAEKNRLGAMHGPMRQNIQTHLAWLQDRIAELDEQVRQTLQQSTVWQDQVNLLKSVPGVGNGLSSLLLVELPELGQLTHKQISSLVGLAPMNRDSGKWHGQRSIWGGRARIRAVLYMSTVAAVRCNPIIRAFYKRLREKGKQMLWPLPGGQHPGASKTFSLGWQRRRGVGVPRQRAVRA